jgi:hypothetical protein
LRIVSLTSNRIRADISGSFCGMPVKGIAKTGASQSCSTFIAAARAKNNAATTTIFRCPRTRTPAAARQRRLPFLIHAASSRNSSE